MGTKKPSGLKIKRDGMKFTFSWSKGEKYSAQQLEYKLYEASSQEIASSGRNFLSQGFEISGTKWVSLSVGSSANDKDLTSLSASDYYPASGKTKRIYGIAFRVRGKADGWSAWVDKTMVINLPKAPTLTSSWSSDNSNRSTYEWSAENEEKKPATNVEYQSIVMENCPEDIKGLAGWNSASSVTKTLTGTDYHDETGLSGTSKTRCVRVRTRGIGGYSAWVYAKHVFAAPLAATIVSHKALYDESTHVWNVSAEWLTPQDAGHPVDNYILQYRIGKPTANMGVTSDGSWTDTAPTTAGDIAVQFTDALAADECLWLRVAASHDNHTGANAIVSTAVRAYTGKPAAPTNLAISASDLDSRTVTIGVTNNSAITDAKVAIMFQPTTEPDDSVIVAVLTGSGSISQSGIKCPSWANTGTLGFRAFAYVGSETYVTDSQSVKHYRVVPTMQSDDVFTTGGIPKAPDPTKTSAVKDGDDIKVSWDWTWQDANYAEVSWSTRKNAWESSSEPDTHRVSSTGPSYLYLTGLEKGQIYYIKVRLLKEVDGVATYGPHSKLMAVNLVEAPAKPVLNVSTDVLVPGDELGLSWVYTSMDGTGQMFAQVAEKSGSTYTPLASVQTAQQVSIKPSWASGTQHDICVKVVSESGGDSGWSDPVKITVSAPPTCTITQANLVAAGSGYEMQSFPLTVTVTGAGTGGQTLLRIIRLEAFTQERPDEKDFNGYAGEIITERLYSGEAQQTINLSDLNEGKSLDDTAVYRIQATVTNGYGQTGSAAVDFTVNWSQQPVDPVGIASVAINGTAAYITISKPTGASNTDTVDIYRLSVDGPELIYRNATFGQIIVDPYPTIGRYGGYRVVLKTANGDYYTSTKEPAWKDYEAGFESVSQYIDFDGYTLPVSYNVDLSSSFTKDFKKTKYLDGHEEGDFLEGVGRLGSMSAVQITEKDVDDIRNLRRLAKYSGLAHIRSKDGSSYWANVNVQDNLDHMSCRLYNSLTLSIEACEQQSLDGLTKAEWEA